MYIYIITLLYHNTRHNHFSDKIKTRSQQWKDACRWVTRRFEKHWWRALRPYGLRPFHCVLRCSNRVRSCPTSCGQTSTHEMPRGAHPATTMRWSREGAWFRWWFISGTFGKWQQPSHPIIADSIPRTCLAVLSLFLTLESSLIVSPCREDKAAVLEVKISFQRFSEHLC